MNIEFITVKEFLDFKKEILGEIRSIITPKDQPTKAWLKTSDVRKILKCSHGTIQNLRINGTLSPSKIGGTWYYSADQVYELLNKTI